MRQGVLSLLLLLGAANLHAKLDELEPTFRYFLTLKETTLRDFLAREGDVSELMADVSEGIDPPEYIDGLICYTCYNCEHVMEIGESPAICNECFEKILDGGQIVRGCNVESHTVCTTDAKEIIRCCKTDHCNGAGKLHVLSACLLVLGMTVAKSFL
eukprot:TsM_000474700 transcript=TsM_000474700 gene=TsM_000474700